ncbi:MAG TPA: hypothetical protein DEB06_07825 [Phycisphaerales bacterium]|nr:hypothetical protein [Phycisphaerales bacterium]
MTIGPGSGPGGGPGIQPGNQPTTTDPLLEGPEPGGGPDTFDFGDGPDAALLCDSGIFGLFPTALSSFNANGGRGSPRHRSVGEGSTVTLGTEVSYEDAARRPRCDWDTAGCDAGDDGALVLCLTNDCESGLFVNRGVCGLGMSASFGPRVAGTPSGFWIVRTRTAAGLGVPAFLNVAVDANSSGVFFDQGAAWCLRDAAVAAGPMADQVHFTSPFPVATYFNAGVSEWAVSAFWSRFMVSEERVSDAFESHWDGSAAAEPYNHGETEDWIARTLPGKWSCRLPESSVEASVIAVVSLDPLDTDCLNGIELTLTTGPSARGVVREFREGAVIAGQPVPAEVRRLDVSATEPGLGGRVALRERTDRISMGVVDVTTASGGVLTSASAFFDLWLAIDLLDQVRTLDTGSVPVRVAAEAIPEFPPVGTALVQPLESAPVPLFDRATLQLAGWMCVLSVQFVDAADARCPGDADGNGVIDFDDISAVLSNWLTVGASGDASGDCMVDFVDITSVLANWNGGCS